MTMNCSPSRLAGNQLIADHAQSQVRTFFDEIKNGTRNYRTVASLNAQIAQEYRGRCILELLQNAHDALANPKPNDPQRISFVLSADPDPVLLVGNSGRPFRHEDFKGICQLAQSPKDPNESVGNKGLGFRSVLEVSGCPEIWSTTPAGSDLCFVFRFDPAVIDQVAEAAQDLKRRGLDARSPFDPSCPLVDWSKGQLDEYRRRLGKEKIDAAQEAREFLSPYAIPLPADGMLPEVRNLLNEGHATVVRLPLDGGRILSGDDAVQSVKNQLDALQDARSVIFLNQLATLVIEVDGERCILNRTVDSEASLAGEPRTRQRQLRVETTGVEPADAENRRFCMWTRIVGGDGDPEGTKRISTAVEHLPNRWPDVRQAAVGIAVEDAPASAEGVFVIFLPTEQKTGTGAHVNAPFYGSLDRRRIDFCEFYNELLLDNLLDLCLDAVYELAAGPPEGWCARAIMDILASMTKVDGEQWSLFDKLRERAEERGCTLDDQALVLCDDGWHTPDLARVMPSLDADDPTEVDRWREHAGFAVVSKELDGREDAVRELIDDLGGKSDPTHEEWASTIERVACQVRDCEPDISWNDFLCSLLSILPDDLRSAPRYGTDPLADAHFLPTEDRRLIAASDSTKLFFQPVQGIDDIVDLVGEVPEVLKERIAFLHTGIQIHEGQQYRNTEVQKFLDDRFALSPRREDILRKVIIPAVPSLPAPHGSPEAGSCAAILAWTLKLLGDEPPDRLLQLLSNLPVACHGGWYRMANATFGPGWPERHGDDLRTLADALPDGVAREQLKNTLLLPPDDERWQIVVVHWGQLFAKAGVFDGLRPQTDDVSFIMNAICSDLPTKCPGGIPSEDWIDWANAVKEDLQSPYTGRHKYELSSVLMLPVLHHLAELKLEGRQALSRLILVSICHWNSSWESIVVRKIQGQSWQKSVFSPLNHWLRNFTWLCDRDEAELLLSQRWLVPESLLRGQAERYSHLDPLSLALAHKLGTDSGLKKQLVRLGLKAYPTEEQDRTGPELLDTLAMAWTNKKVPAGRFDVFLGQVRDAWRHLDTDKGLPDTVLVRIGQKRAFSTHGLGELADVYLPDRRERTRTLQEHGKAILEMYPRDARRLASALTDETDIGRASHLKERHVVDGAAWKDQGREQADQTLPLDKAEYRWLPVVLLSVAAHGGTNPAGATTEAWRNAADRLRSARVLKCDEISVELVDDNRVVGASEPRAKWLPGDVLAVRRDITSYGELAEAAQALLDRQDLLKDLRLVLGGLSMQDEVTRERIESALAPSEIDAQAFADIHQQWDGNTGLLLDRIRPVLMLFEIPEEGLDAVAADLDRLTEWLSAKLPQWPTPALLQAARESRDDHAMGMAAWRALEDCAQLPAWNAVLEKLGDRYEAVENPNVSEQTTAYLEEAKALLRGLARHVAVETDSPDLFHQIEMVSRDFEGGTNWSKQWWEVPFGAVVKALRNLYAKISGFEDHLQVLEGAETVEALRERFQQRNIEITPDPYETAESNMNRLKEALADVHDLYQAWMEARTATEIQTEHPDMPDVPPAAYLRRWPNAEFLKTALEILDDEEFTHACSGCSTLGEIRQRLDLMPEAVEARRQERHRLKQEAVRKRRTFDVAGTPFEVGGGESYRDLFGRLNNFPVPEGPRASRDEFTPLAETHRSREHGGGGGTGNRPSQPPPSADHRELVGIVGEIQAYRYLRKEFGEEAVTHDAWVSEIRLKVLPLVEGEPNNVSDGHGFDFEFAHKRKKWQVEVKATAGEDSQFELGISEIRAANRLARKRGGRWRILRVRNALSDCPQFDWLPNPFEDQFKKCYRLHQGGMRVSYSRR